MTVIDEDIPCRACRYNLRGLTRSGRCPECGDDIAGSMWAHFEARERRRPSIIGYPKLLRRLIEGCIIFLLVAAFEIVIGSLEITSWWSVTPRQKLGIRVSVQVITCLAILKVAWARPRGRDQRTVASSWTITLGFVGWIVMPAFAEVFRHEQAWVWAMLWWYLVGSIVGGFAILWSLGWFAADLGLRRTSVQFSVLAFISPIAFVVMSLAANSDLEAWNSLPVVLTMRIVPSVTVSLVRLLSRAPRLWKYVFWFAIPGMSVWTCILLAHLLIRALATSAAIVRKNVPSSSP